MTRIVIYWKGGTPNDPLIVEAIRRVRSTGGRVVRMEDQPWFAPICCAKGGREPHRPVVLRSTDRRGATVIEAEV